MTNFALERRFEELKVPFARARVGDRYVLEILETRGWLFGGEGSGHILCLDRHTTGDGIITSLQVLAALRRANASLTDLTADLLLLPQSLINVKVRPGFDWQASAPLKAQQEAAARELAGRGRILIRASGTEPLLRVMVEADDAGQAQALAERIAGAIAATT